MAKKAERPALVWSLRACLLLEFCSALGMIIYALILENPPKTALPLGLLIIGCFSMVCVLIGLIGSLRVACCLSVYLVLGGALTLAELAITISMFFNVDSTVDAIYKQSRAEGDKVSKDSIRADIEGGRWFFLVVCILQFISMLVALVLRLCIYPRARDFEEFQESGSEASSQPDKGQVQMQKLQSSISGRTSLGAAAHSPGTAAYASSRLDRSTTAKMAAKYGAYSEEYRKKSVWERMTGK